MSSSVYEKVRAVEKAKKVERRNAIEKRNQPVNDQQEHIEAEIRRIPAETSSSDSAINSGEIKAVSKPKAKAKKTSGIKKGGSSKKVFSDSKATKI